MVQLLGSHCTGASFDQDQSMSMSQIRTNVFHRVQLTGKPGNPNFQLLRTLGTLSHGPFVEGTYLEKTCKVKNGSFEKLKALYLR
jgi:hypothetical protein